MTVVGTSHHGTDPSVCFTLEADLKFVLNHRPAKRDFGIGAGRERATAKRRRADLRRLCTAGPGRRLGVAPSWGSVVPERLGHRSQRCRPGPRRRQEFARHLNRILPFALWYITSCAISQPFDSSAIGWAWCRSSAGMHAGRHSRPRSRVSRRSGSRPSAYLRASAARSRNGPHPGDPESLCRMPSAGD